MKKRACQLVGWFLSASLLAAHAANPGAQHYVNTLFQRWTSPETRWEGYDVAARRQEFLDVPESIRREVADGLFDRAASTTPPKRHIVQHMLQWMTEERSFLSSEPFEANIRRLAGDEEWLMRKSVVDFLGKRDKAEDRVLINAGLKDRNARVRCAALEAMSGKSDKDYNLIKTALKDANPEVRVSALRAALTGNAETDHVLFSAALTDGDARVRAGTVMQLLNSPHKYRDIIDTALKDANTEVQRAALLVAEDWPDGEAIRQTYIQRRGSDPAAKDAVQEAKAMSELYRQKTTEAKGR